MTARKTTTIDAESGVVTLSNVFEVAPEKQDELARLLSETAEKVLRRLPGFVSVSIHRSLDGTRVANYTQWASKEDLDGVNKSPEAQDRFKQVGAVAKGMSPALYQVSSVHTN